MMQQKGSLGVRAWFLLCGVGVMIISPIASTSQHLDVAPLVSAHWLRLHVQGG